MSKLFLKTKNILSTISKQLFGQFSWNSPPWINQLQKIATQKPRQFWGITLLTLVLITVIICTWCWYQSLPKPELITTHITAPTITPNDHLLIPQNLTIDFGTSLNNQFTNKPVAPLNQVGKPVMKGISITPRLEGKWVWESDSRLTFTPSVDWPAGQEYQLHFSKDVFTKDTPMASWTASFSTLPFKAIISEFKFYQDPLHAEIRQAIATIQFNFPVDIHTIENHISLSFQSLTSENPIPFTLTYDEHHRIVYLKSETISLPDAERYLVLTLNKGIQPIEGNKMMEKVSAKVLIPDASSYFKINQAATSIVRNLNDRPEQILNIETSLGVTQAELSQYLHVYILPQDYPATATEDKKINYRWNNPGEVNESILALSTPLSMQNIPTEHENATLNSFKYNVKTPAYLYLKIDKGMRSFGHFSLSNTYTAILSAPVYPQEISFLHKGALLALGTEEKISSLVRGLAAVKFEFARVFPNDVNHLITQTGGDFNNPYFINYNFNRDNISEIFSEIKTFDMSDPGKTQYTALDLHQYLAQSNGQAPLGLFLLQAHGWDTVKKINLDIQASRLVLITDLGMIVKDNIDSTHDLFVQSITQGMPVPNASVAILGKNGFPILTRITDTQGHVSFPSLKDFMNEREPTVYIVQNGSDISFIPYNRYERQLNYSRFDIGGVNSRNENTAALTAYLFSDRGIYRPGDMAHIGMIIKQPYVLPALAGVPLIATVVDPRGTTVKNVKMTLNESGYLSFDFQTTDHAPTGQYQIYLYIAKDNHAGSLIGSTSIRVAEFLPDRMRINEHLSQPISSVGFRPSN